MHINKIHIDKIGKFEDRTIEFNKQLTILTGESTTGKSFTLNTIAALLRTISACETSDALEAEMMMTRSFNRAIPNSYVGDTDTEATISYDVGIAGELSDWMLGKFNVTLKKGPDGYLEPDVTCIKGYSDARIDLPAFPQLFLYYTDRRFPVRIPTSLRSSANYAWEIIAHKCSLDDVDLEMTLSWYDEKDVQQARRSVALYESTGEWGDRLPELKYVNEMMSAIIPHISDLHVHPSEGILSMKYEGKETLISHLGAGMRTLIGTVFDLICRTAMLTERIPGLSDHPTRGIVLIDDLTIGLSQDMIGMILPRLIKAFPEIQFIVTTATTSGYLEYKLKEYCVDM